MNQNMKEKIIKDYRNCEQHVVMLKEPYPLIYNYETAQPAIHIGTLNLMSFTTSLKVQAYPIIRPLLLNDEDGEINPSGVISPYSLYDGGFDDESEWINICILQETVKIEDLFPILHDYCFVENTLNREPTEIITALRKYGCHIEMPTDRELNILLDSDDGVTWHSEWSGNNDVADSIHLTNMWFLAAGGGSLPANIENMVNEAILYDSLFLEDNNHLPIYKFLKNPAVEGDIDYINKTFTEWLDKKRRIYYERC